MRLKKIITTFLIAVLFFAQFSWINFGDLFTSYAVNSAMQDESSETVATKYFYNQLTPDAKVFYDAMKEMLIKDTFDTLVAEEDFGKKSTEITSAKLSGLEEKLNAYVEGKSDLLNTMGAARDAFMSDYAGLFYIDWDYFSMRVTQQNGTKHLYIGTGRSDNYINKDFLKEDGSIDKEKIKNAYTAINQKIDEIVTKANAVETKVGQNKREQQIKIVHEEVIKAAKYTYDYKAEKAPWSVRTIYGVFGSQEAVCAGYSKALKIVLDKLQIPCVLVTGIYKVTEDQNEEHMWVYVQLDDGKWYAVDPTFDNTDEMEGETEKVSMKYFLVGFDKMVKHIPTGIVSESNFEFTYPPLESVSDKYETIYEEGDLKVELDDEGWDPHDEESVPLYKVSYKGMGYAEAAKHGYYILMNQSQEYLDGTTRSSGWSYPNPDIYNLLDKKEALYLAMSHISYFQISVTDIAPEPMKDASSIEEIRKQTTYMGPQTSLMETTEIIRNPLGTYIAPPYVKKATPSLGSAQMIGTTHHVSIEYDDFLIPDNDENTEIGIEVSSLDRVTGKHETIDAGNFKVENFNFDGQSTISFDFTPSEMFADDTIFYDIQPTGLIGSKSNKKPMATSYLLSHGCCIYAYKAQGFDLNVYGKPVLMDDVDVTKMNIEDMTEEQKQEMADILKHRLTLVTQKTTDAQDKEMLEGMENYIEQKDNGREVLGTETYNISLTLCKMQSEQLLSGAWNGQKMRVMLGFPAGYGPEDEGVTFKVYHYKRNDQGKITDVEEIPCTVTKLGLILEIDSFSPFTIAAVEETEAEKANTDKTIVIQSTEGGKVTMDESATLADTVKVLKSGESETVKISADEGYEIDELVIGETVIDLSNFQAESNKGFVKTEANNSATEVHLKLEHDDQNLADGTTMIKVAFAKKSVRDAEKSQGVSVVAQPVVEQASFTMTSKAYKQIDAGDGKTIRKQAEALQKDDEFELTFSIESLLNVGNGINTIGGTISYDKSKLECLGATAIDKVVGENLRWGVTLNKEDGKFIASLANDTQEKPLAKDTGEIFTIKFKVLASGATTDSIIVTNLEAGTGTSGVKAIAKASDISTVINIIPGISDSLTISAGKADGEAKNYHIGETYITLPIGTTVQEFENNTDSSKTARYAENIEEIVDENNIVTPSKLQEIADVTRTLHTGDEITVGDKTWTFVVRGDTDGDGKVSINDLAKSKLHLTGKELMYGAYLEAAETDNTQNFTVNDIAKMKLYIIQKITDLFADLV